MTKFKIGDEVRIKKALGAINHKTNKPFKKNDITTVTGVITDYHVRVGHGLNHQDSGNVMYVENLELVDEEKNLYVEKDIYEGMVLECVKSDDHYWSVGKKYIVDKHLRIYDEDHVKRDIKNIVNRLNNPNEYIVNFKVVEHEEEPMIDDKLTHLHSVVITVPKKDVSGSYVNYNWLLKKTLLSTGVLVKLSKCDKLVSINESVEYINVEALHEDLVLLTKSMNPVINELRNLNQTTLDLKLNGQHFVLDTQEELDYSTTLINGLIGNI